MVVKNLKHDIVIYYQHGLFIAVGKLPLLQISMSQCMEPDYYNSILWFLGFSKKFVYEQNNVAILYQVNLLWSNFHWLHALGNDLAVLSVLQTS